MSRLPQRTPTWVTVALAYITLTVIFLWPAVLPWTVHTRTQTRDAALIYTIAGHSSNALFGRDSNLWNFEIFHPLPNMLCLSEPMLTPAVLLAPLIHTIGAGAAHNIWMYICWFSAAFGMWAYLRHRGIDNWAAFWGGAFVAFTPDRLWHAAGHSHLYFQAGFPLVLLFVERVVCPASSRLWSVAFGLILMIQVFSGFYISAMFVLWCFFMLPAAVWTATDGQVGPLRSAIGRHGRIVLAGIVLTAVLLFPVARKYQEFSAHFPHNPLEHLRGTNSATWKGYFLPPADPSRCYTLAGLLYTKIRGISIRHEDTQFLGFTPVLLLLVGCFGSARLTRGHTRKRDMIFLGSAIFVGLVAYILSLGPFLFSDLSRLTRLPFAYLYAWVPPIRFFRAPARFAFVVEWTVGIVGAYGLWYLRDWLTRKGRTTLARWIGPTAVLILLFEFFPLTRIYQIPMGRNAFSNFLLSEPKRIPFVQVPVESEFMTQLAWHYTPMANGYSGYSPPMRDQELKYFDRHFPEPDSLMLLDRWQVRRVFVTTQAPENVRRAARGSRFLRSAWSGDEGVLYELVADPQEYAVAVSTRRTRALAETGQTTQPITLFSDHKFSNPAWAFMTEMVPANTASPSASSSFTSISPHPTLFLRPKGQPLQPSLYSRLSMRVRISNWYNLNEPGSIYWVTQRHANLSEERAFKFVIPADGNMHQVDVNLGELITWTMDDPVLMLRIDFGGRMHNTVDIESLVLESTDVSWDLR